MEDFFIPGSSSAAADVAGPDCKGGLGLGLGPDCKGGEAAQAKAAHPKRPNSLCCGHVFCFECLDQFLRTPEGTKCPICRAPVDGSRPAQAPPGDRHDRPYPNPNPNPPPGDRHDRPLTRGAGAGGGRGCSADFASSASASSSYQGIRHNLMWSRSAELHYRLARMRLLYPDTMTAETLGAISAGVDSGSVQQIQAAVDTRSAAVLHTVSQIQSRRQAQSSGSKGTRWSGGGFGGGRSSGGGGGRW